jgi:hypothetical protein
MRFCLRARKTQGAWERGNITLSVITVSVCTLVEEWKSGSMRLRKAARLSTNRADVAVLPRPLRLLLESSLIESATNSSIPGTTERPSREISLSVVSHAL